jgi:hypothetical protein
MECTGDYDNGKHELVMEMEFTDVYDDECKSEAWR